MMTSEGSPREMSRSAASPMSLPRLQFVSPPKSAGFVSPESIRAHSVSSRPTSNTRQGFYQSNILAQTPASSLNARLKAQASPGDLGSTTASASKIRKLFNDFEKQRGADEARYSLKLRDLEEEKNRVAGENESLHFELEKMRQLEFRAKRDADENKERLVQMKKDFDTLKREEEGKRRQMSSELEDAKRAITAMETARSKLERDLDMVRKYCGQVEMDLDAEKDRAANLVETSVKRAVEKERLLLEKQYETDRAAQSSELELVKKQLFEKETNEIRLNRELDDLKKQLERNQVEAQREKAIAINELSTRLERAQTEVESLTKQLEIVNEERTQLESNLNDSRMMELRLNKEFEEEKTRTEQRLVLACKRAVEKDREERKLRAEVAEKEELKRRQALEQTVEELKQRISHLQLEKQSIEKELDESKTFAEQLQQDLDVQKQKESQRIESACKKAVEQERTSLEMENAHQKSFAEKEIAGLRIALNKSETSNARMEKENTEAKRIIEKLRLDMEKMTSKIQSELEMSNRDHELKIRMFQGELETIKTRLVTSEEARRRMEKEANEFRKLNEALEAENLSEKDRLVGKIEGTVKRALEKERAEHRNQLEALEREEERKRLLLEKELDDLRAQIEYANGREHTLDREMDDLREELRQQRVELDRERASWQEQLDSVIKRAERDKKAIVAERHQLERQLEEAEELKHQWSLERESLQDIQEQLQTELAALEVRLQDATAREERLLLDMAELRGRASSDRIVAISRRPLLDYPPSGPSAVSSLRPPPPSFTSSNHRMSLSSSSLRSRPPLKTVSSAEPVSLRMANSRTTPFARRVAMAKRYLDSDGIQ